VYDIDRLALWLKISINVFVEFGIFFFVGSSIGLISLGSPANIGLYAGMAAVLFLAGCSIDYLFFKREARKINSKLREHDTD